ncbi:hypothetical protein BBP40_011928 [Aspergillus hancockii]|nr:hypothetical protein BBP40_011928 [Aspergillus hancockii]
MSGAVLITGATGKRGGSVIDALYEARADMEILAVTRKINSPGAQRIRIKYPKVKLVKGSMNDVDGIFSNAANVASFPIWGVFSVPAISPMRPKHHAEEQQGKALVDAAIKNNVQLFVYTSVDRGGEDSLNHPTDVPHLTAKHNIEKYLLEKSKATDMDWVILRPTCFFDNFVPGFAGKLTNTCWKVALKDKPLQLIAVSDIGFFGAQAFLKPEEYKGRFISLAGDEMTFEEMERLYKGRTGQDLPLTYGLFARCLMWMVDDIGRMYRWFYQTGFNADIQTLKKIHPGLKDFATWLEEDTDYVPK